MRITAAFGEKISKVYCSVVDSVKHLETYVVHWSDHNEATFLGRIGAHFVNQLLVSQFGTLYEVHSVNSR